MTNWTDDSSSPCSWHGVTSSKDVVPRVTALDLSYSGLVGSLNLFILTSMSALRGLYLQGNSFSAAEPGDLSASAACVFDTLDLSSNNISEALPGPPQSFFSSCKNLACVNLSRNLLSGQIPSGFVTDSLKHLDLSDNNLFIGQIDFGHCRNLTVLGLSQNSLSEFPAAANCTLLEVLDLSQVLELQNTRIPGSLLGNFKHLRRLSLSQNQFIGEIPLELGRTCRTLEKLDLSSNHLAGGYNNLGSCELN